MIDGTERIRTKDLPLSKQICDHSTTPAHVLVAGLYATTYLFPSSTTKLERLSRHLRFFVVFWWGKDEDKATALFLSNCYAKTLLYYYMECNIATAISSWHTKFPQFRVSRFFRSFSPTPERYHYYMPEWPFLLPIRSAMTWVRTLALHIQLEVSLTTKHARLTRQPFFERLSKYPSKISELTLVL